MDKFPLEKLHYPSAGGAENLSFFLENSRLKAENSRFHLENSRLKLENSSYFFLKISPD